MTWLFVMLSLVAGAGFVHDKPFSTQVSCEIFRDERIADFAEEERATTIFVCLMIPEAALK